MQTCPIKRRKLPEARVLNNAARAAVDRARTAGRLERVKSSRRNLQRCLRGFSVLAACVGLGAAVWLLWDALPSRALAAEDAPAFDRNVSPDPARALRAAVTALEQREFALAEWLLFHAAERFPLIADHADLMRVGVFLAGGKPWQAAQLAEHALQRHPSSPLRSFLFRAQGDALRTLRDEVGARAAWTLALQETQAAAQRAELEFELAASFLRAGEGDVAARHLLAVYADYAVHPLATEAERELATLETHMGRDLRTASVEIRRADVLFAASRSEEALAAYEAALQRKDLAPDEQRRAQGRRGQCLFNLRRYTEAIEIFSALLPDSDAAFWHARSLARSGDLAAGVAAFEALAERAEGLTGARAQLYAGLLLEDSKVAAERVRALAHSAAVLQRTSDPSLRSAALWSLGWAAYRNGARMSAVEYFQGLATTEKDPIARLRPRYWSARALQAEHADIADAEFAALAQAYPYTYYGWRARQRSPLPDIPPARRQLPEGSVRLQALALLRARVLIDAGLSIPAQRELEAQVTAAGGIADRIALARLFVKAESPDRAVQLIAGSYADVLAAGPVAGFEDLWQLAWPLPHADAVARAAETKQHAALVYAVMREESLFRPEALSSAGARGLLQVMPATGEQLAQELGFAPFSAAALFQPWLNIALGSHYLKSLRERFSGRLSAVIASYNAGPEAVEKWLTLRHDGDDDEWVEAIPYPQTRIYTQRVLRSWRVYRDLYR